MEVSMAKDKQNIVVTGRAAHQRIEDAIPLFQERYGMSEDQAIAVAIRLESVNRLKGNDGVIAGNPKPFGPGRFAVAAMAISQIPKKNVRKNREPIETEDMDTLRRAYAPPKRKRAAKRIRNSKPKRKGRK